MTFDEVLLEVECASCGAIHDAFGYERGNGWAIDSADRRCPDCDSKRVASISPRESLA